MKDEQAIEDTTNDPLTHNALQCYLFFGLIQHISFLDVAVSQRMTAELLPCEADNPYVDHRGMSTLLGDDKKREIGVHDANPTQHCWFLQHRR